MDLTKYIIDKQEENRCFNIESYDTSTFASYNNLSDFNPRNHVIGQIILETYHNQLYVYKGVTGRTAKFIKIGRKG